MSTENSWKMFILFKEHRLNPERFINIELLSKIGIEDIMGQSIPDFITVASIQRIILPLYPIQNSYLILPFYI